MGKEADQTARDIMDYAEAKVAIERAGGTWTEEKGCLEVVLWFFLPIALLLLQLRGS